MEKINNSLLSNEDKTLNLVKVVLAERNVNSRYVPETFKEVSKESMKSINLIDNIHEKNIISREVAIQLIADLFELEDISNGIRKQFDTYVDQVYLIRLRDLYDEIYIKYNDLLASLNTGKIDYKEFIEKYAKLREIFSNSMNEINSQNTNLKKNSR